MKRIILILLLCLPLCGCITQQDLQTATEATTKVLLAVEENRDLIGDAVEAGVLSTEEAVRANKNIDKVIADTKALKDVIEAAETPAEAIGGMIEASGAMGNPYAKQMTIAFGLLTPLLAWWGNQNRLKANKAEAKRQADKEGRERTLREIATMDQPSLSAETVESLMYNNIGNARSRNGVT